VPPRRVSLWDARKGTRRLRARSGHAPSANPLILVTAGDHSGPPKSLFSLDSLGVWDVGVAGSYMDAPPMPSLFFGSGFQGEIAAIHSASVNGAWPRALME
jgi:hypothetical protein